MDQPVYLSIFFLSINDCRLLTSQKSPGLLDGCETPPDGGDSVPAPMYAQATMTTTPRDDSSN